MGGGGNAALHVPKAPSSAAVPLLVAVLARPLADAAGEGTEDVAQIATAQVEPELFEGILDFGEGMVPAHHLVAAVEVVDVVDDVARVVEGELQLVARHGEDAAKPARHGLQLG